MIDAHVHILPRARLRGLMRWIHRSFPDHPVPPGIDEAGIREDLSSHGVRGFFNHVYPLSEGETDSLNEFCRELSVRMPEAAPFGSLHVETPDKNKVVTRLIESYRFVGLKFHPFIQDFDPADDRMMVVYKMMEEYQKPVFIHTGFDDFYKKKLPAERIEAILGRHPDLPLVLSHTLFPNFQDAGGIMERYPGVYLDATNVFGALGMYQDAARDEAGRRYTEELTDRFRGLIRRFTDRTLFGSDHPAGVGGLREIHDDLFSFGLDDDLLDRITRENPERFIARFAPHIDALWRTNGVYS
jgi:predicted TIM-barrel fold metal-dependent hydrolase